jgi:hypothetical protein
MADDSESARQRRSTFGSAWKMKEDHHEHTQQTVLGQGEDGRWKSAEANGPWELDEHLDT